MFKVYHWTQATSRKPRCLSADSCSLYLQLKPTIWAQSFPRKYTNCTTPLQGLFPAPLRHAEKQQLDWNWEKLSLQSSSLQPPKQMLIGPPNDWATAYDSYWKLRHWTSKNSMRCAKKCFFIILAKVISGMPTSEICFLPGQFRLTILPKSTTASHSVSVNRTTTFRLRGGRFTTGLSPPMLRCQEMLWFAVGALLRNQRCEKKD